MTSWQRTNLEEESLVEDGVESFAVNLRLVFLLLVRHQVHLHVRVRRSRHVHAGQVGTLDDTH